MINVTKTFFPPLEEYQEQLQRIWKNQWLTNRGELVLELEEKLKNYLSVDHILVTNNGTIPIQIALKLLIEHECEKKIFNKHCFGFSTYPNRSLYRALDSVKNML